MKKISAIIAGIVLIAGAAFAVDQVTHNDTETYSWRYKMTVTVDTPEGEKSGSSVREIKITKKLIAALPVTDPKTKQEKIKEHYKFEKEVKGEAVVVDLEERGKVFGIITDTAYADVLYGFDIQKYEAASNLPVGSKSELKCEKHFYCPMIVTFTDIDDPMSAKLVFVHKRYAGNAGKNRQYEDNFEDLFGEGVALKSIQLEITDEPVVWSIETILPWLKEVGGGYLDGRFSSRGAPLGLHGGNFKYLLKDN